MKVVSRTDEKIVLEMANVEAPIVNALRRIMISEVTESMTLYVDSHHGHSQGGSHPEYLRHPR